MSPRGGVYKTIGSRKNKVGIYRLKTNDNSGLRAKLRETNFWPIPSTRIQEQVLE